MRIVLMVIALLLANASLYFSGTAALANTESTTYMPSYGLDNVPSYLQPVGGGAGYDATGSYSLLSGPRIWHAGMAGITATVDQCTYSQLQTDITNAQSGAVIFIPGTCQINFNGQSYIDIPANVTVASDRGYAGSQGALLYKTGSESGFDYMFRLHQRYARLTGLRLLNLDAINNLDPTSGTYCGAALNPGASYVEIDNNEIAGFGRANIYIEGSGLYGTELNAHDIYIHNDNIYAGYCTGLGYGISITQSSSVAIEANIFNTSKINAATDGSFNTTVDMGYNFIGPVEGTTGNYAGNALNEHAHTGGGQSAPDTSGPYSGQVVGSKQFIFHHNYGENLNATLDQQGGVLPNGTFIAYNRLHASITDSPNPRGSCPWGGYGAGDPGRCNIGQPFYQEYNFGNIFIQNNYITGMYDHPATYLYTNWTNYHGNISLVAHSVPLTGGLWPNGNPSNLYNAGQPVMFWFPPNFTVMAGNTLSFQVDGMSPIINNKNISAPLSYSVSGAPTGSSFDAGSQYFSWTPSGSVTGWVGPITFTATDPGGNSTSRTTMINVLLSASETAYTPSIPMDLGTILLIAVVLALLHFKKS